MILLPILLQAAAPAEMGCAEPQTQSAMNRCAAQDSASADAALNRHWELTADRMRALDAEIEQEYDKQPGYFETLLEGQRAWLALRDAQCRMESLMARGGSMQPLLYFHCKTRMTASRIQYLRNLAAGPESSCLQGEENNVLEDPDCPSQGNRVPGDPHGEANEDHDHRLF